VRGRSEIKKLCGGGGRSFGGGEGESTILLSAKTNYYGPAF